jgi:transposase
MGNCAGIDWASEKHDVLIAGEAGDELLAATFPHDESGITSLCRAMVRHDVEAVAIERPDGVLVERLLDAGVRVLALHPNQVKAARDRFRASGGKSDRFDRFVLCELARTDRHRFRLLEPDLDETKALRALTRAREDLVAARVALANQLRAELERFWPGPVGLFSDLDSPISLAFLARYPSPSDARGLGEKRLAAFLKAHRYTNRKTAAQLLERLRSAPSGRADELETARRRSIVLRLTRTLQTMVEQIRELEREIGEALDAHPDGEIFRSFFRSPGSVICAATLLAEIGDCRGRYPHRDAIAADAGQAPVAVESGKRKHPLGVQQTAAQRARHARAQHPPMEPLGRRALRRGQGPRPQPHPCATHPRPRLEPHHLALLAEPDHLRPPTPHRPPTTRGLTQDVFHPAAASRGAIASATTRP